MKNLLDTHTFIWFVNGDKELSSKAKKTIDNGENYLSIASIWEIAIKISVKKLELYTSFKEINNQLSRNYINVLPISIEDTFVLSELPFHHKDPFDRIIISQSISNNLTVILRDKEFDSYDIRLVW